MQEAEKINNKYYLSDSLFFLASQGKMTVWNYETHEQYELEAAYLNELLHVSQHHSPQHPDIFKELLAAGLITEFPHESNNWGWDVLSKIFHIGTNDVLSSNNPDAAQFAESYLAKCSALDSPLSIKLTISENTIVLPVPDISKLKNVSFYDSIIHRKTCRHFYDTPTSLETLSLMLFISFGHIHGEWQEFKEHNLEQISPRKAHPSGGGIHAEEAYVACFRIEGIEPGLYHYIPDKHQLALFKPGDFEDDIIQMNYHQHYSKGLAFGIYITSRLSKIWWKYKHSRSYRSALLDIGHASQTFLTTATCLGLQTWLSAAFQDSKVRDFLKLTTDDEQPILFVGAGHGNNQAIPQSIIDALQR